MNILLHVSGLSKIYGGAQGAATTQALNDVTFVVHSGEFLAIMGPSGSGKTTLLNILAGIDTPTAGKVCINGKPFTELTGEDLAAFRRAHLGFVFQDYNLLDTLTLAENVALPLLLDRRNALPRVRQTLALLGITALADRFPYQVSGGQQQRAAVARAIVHEPDLVLADEPTGNLDSSAAQALLEQFRVLNQRLHATIVMVTHDARAARYADRVIFLKDGTLSSTLVRGAQPPRQFLSTILDVLGTFDEGAA